MRPSITSDEVLQQVVEILRGPPRQQERDLVRLLVGEYGLNEKAVVAVLHLTGRGTNHAPNARLRKHGATLDFAKEDKQQGSSATEQAAAAAGIGAAAVVGAGVLIGGLIVSRKAARVVRRALSSVPDIQASPEAAQGVSEAINDATVSLPRQVPEETTEGSSVSPGGVVTTEDVDTENVFGPGGLIGRTRDARAGEDQQLTIVREARRAEVFYRAGYVLNASKRLTESLTDRDETWSQAWNKERNYHRQHEKARSGRLDAAAQVQVAAEFFGQDTEGGILLGWYHNPLLNNTPDCLAASGNNFYAAQGTAIGYPGSVHENCGCYAGPVHTLGGMVNEVLKNLSMLDQHRVNKFRPKKRRKTA